MNVKALTDFLSNLDDDRIVLLKIDGKYINPSIKIDDVTKLNNKYVDPFQDGDIPVVILS